MTTAPSVAQQKSVPYNPARDVNGKRDRNSIWEETNLTLNAVGLGQTVSSWILIVLAAAFTIAFVLTAKSWREARRSPYYFQRKQAMQQMQSYSLVSMTLMMATAAIVAYTWSPTVSAAPRTAIITNAKPTSLSASVEAQPAVVQQSASPLLQRSALALPPEFSNLEPQVALAEETAISDVVFASGVNDNYEPIGARTVFGEGQFTLFATFDYASMDDGMTWAWVWRENGSVVGGGEQHWVYGEDGPGYVYLQPEEGFTAGDYSLELYVNGELHSQAQLEVSSGVANQ